MGKSLKQKDTYYTLTLYRVGLKPDYPAVHWNENGIPVAVNQNQNGL
jgi:hypothetical protein